MSRFKFSSAISAALLIMLVNTSSHAVVTVESYTHVFAGTPSATKVQGKIEEFKRIFFCVGIHRGESYPCTIRSELYGIRDSESNGRFFINNMLRLPDDLTCPQTTAVGLEELLIYGGHSGDQETNWTYGTTNYELDGSSAGGEGENARYVVEGEMKTSVASELIYKTTKKAGIYSAITTMEVPDHPARGWVWVFPNGYSINHHVDRHLIGVFGLNRIEGCPDNQWVAGQNYKLSRGDVSTHPEAQWALPATINVAKALANSLARKYQEPIMSYNDFSLVMGGFSHHISHRTGKDIDLNPAGMGNYNCNGTSNLYIGDTFTQRFGMGRLIKGRSPISARDKANDKNFPNLHCYTDGRMHIDAVPGF